MHREYYNWKFLAVLLLPPIAAVGLFHLFLGEKAVRAWDFARLDPAQWEWQFPAGPPVKTPEGAACVLAETGPVLRHDALNLAASAFRAVRIRMRMIDGATGKEATPECLLYWARHEDIARAQGNLPFNFAERGCSLYIKDPRNPDVYWADPPKTQGRIWDGTIQTIMIAAKIPSNSPQGWKLTVASIELLTNVP